MLALVSLVVLSQWASGPHNEHMRESRRLGERSLVGQQYAFFEFAPANGNNMGAVCACTTPSGAKGETMTFDRASSATCTKTATGGLALTGIADGDLVTCSTNQPRVVYDSGGVKGILVEKTRTNIAIRSQEFDNAAWADFTAGAGVAPTKNAADSTTAPDGTTTAETVTFGATGAADSSGLSQTILTATAYSASIYARGNATTASGTFDVCMDNAATADCVSCSYVLASWTRCTLSNITSKASGLVYVGNLSSLNGGTVRSGQTVTLWGAQAEASKYVTSYIPTTSAAVARNRDRPAFALSNGLALGSMAISVDYLGTSDSPLALTVTTDGSDLWELYVSGTGLATPLAFTHVGASNDQVNSAVTIPYSTASRLVQYRSATPELCVKVNATQVCDGTGVAATITTSGGAGVAWPGGYTTANENWGGIVSRVCIDPSPDRCR